MSEIPNEHGPDTSLEENMARTIASHLTTSADGCLALGFLIGELHKADSDFARFLIPETGQQVMEYEQSLS